MYLFLESLRSALASIRAHRLRSFLTSLGIIIGVASVITVISLIQGLSKTVSKEFQGLGGNAFTITARNDFKTFMSGKTNTLRFDDIEYLRAHIEGIYEVSPSFGLPPSEIRFGASAETARVFAAGASYQKVQQRYTRLGRFHGPTDETGARRVVVIGDKLIEALNLPEQPLGQFIAFNGEWFKIIGVMEKRGELFGVSQDDYLIIPFQTGRSIVGNNQPIKNLTLTVTIKDAAKADEVRLRMASVLRTAHRLAPGEPDDFKIDASDQVNKSLEQITTTVTLVMGGIVGIALLVGGIGIMNIMLVSVTERTREIGICKAIGARRQDILMQFLIEAVTLSLMGGAIGLVLGYAMGYGIAALIPNFPDPVVPWWAVVMSVLFSAGVGIVFGVLPALKASRLDPIEALRYE
jgi:putative ABC transport system permease protein